MQYFQFSDFCKISAKKGLKSAFLYIPDLLHIGMYILWVNFSK